VSSAPTTGLTLDTGALLALDHPSKAVLMQAMLDEARRRDASICIPVGVIARAWRGLRQARLARLVTSADVEIAAMTLSIARTVGTICAKTGHEDVIDVHVALCARERQHAVITSDLHDLRRVDPGPPLIRV